MKLSHSVINRYNLGNIKVEDFNNILDKHTNDYKKKIIRFKFSCKISSIIIRDYPKHILIKKYKFKPSDTINMQITFTTKLNEMTYKHYLQQLRQAIENRFIEKIIQNPNPIKLSNSFPQPVFKNILLKYWGVHHVLNGENCLLYLYEWPNMESNIQPTDVTNHD